MVFRKNPFPMPLRCNLGQRFMCGLSLFFFFLAYAVGLGLPLQAEICGISVFQAKMILWLFHVNFLEEEGEGRKKKKKKKLLTAPLSALQLAAAFHAN